MKPAEQIIRLFKKSNVAAGPKVDERILGDALGQLEKFKKAESASAEQNIWRIIMKSKMTKFAAAAVIVIAVLIGVDQFGGFGKGSGVAWADVGEKVEQIQTFTYRRTESQMVAGKKQMKDYITKVYSSSKYGTRMDSYTNGEITISTYTLRAEKILVSVMHPMKKYAQHPLDEEALRKMDKMGPKQIVKRFTSLKYRELGHKVIDGVEAEGIEVNDPKILSGANFPIDSLTARLWVNGATEVPVLLEVEIIGNEGSLEIKTVMDRFEWDIQLDASEFELNIPDDYTLLEE